MELASEPLSCFDICLHQCFPPAPTHEINKNPDGLFYRRFNIIRLSALDRRVQHEMKYSEPFSTSSLSVKSLYWQAGHVDTLVPSSTWAASPWRELRAEERDECEQRTCENSSTLKKAGGAKTAPGSNEELYFFLSLCSEFSQFVSSSRRRHRSRVSLFPDLFPR